MSVSTRLLLIPYLRLSIEDDNEGESNSIASQRAMIDYFLQQHPEFGDYEVLEIKDDGYSGTNFNRPGICRVLELVRQRKVGCIIVKDLSRFGRNYKEVGSYLEMVFPFLGVRFISLNDGYDSSLYDGATGGINIACKALIHDLYSRDISHKIKSSRYARIKRGDYFCSFAPYGYEKNSEDKHKLVLDPPAAAVVRRIFDMTLAGMGTTEIARTLNDEDVSTPLVYMRQKYPKKRINAAPDNFWDNHTVLDILNDERYTGKAISGERTVVRVGGKKRRRTSREEWYIVPDSFEAIVSETDFQAAQACINHLTKKGGAAPSTHLFHRMVRCAGCGRTMLRSNTRVRYFYCNTNDFTPCPTCADGHLMESDLIEAVLVSIRQQARVAVDADQVIRRERQNHSTRLASLERQIKGLTGKLNALNLSRMELFEKLNDGQLTADEYKALRDSAGQKISEVEAEIARLTIQADVLRKTEPENHFILLFRPHEQIKTLTREIVDALIESIRVYAADRIEIRWKHQDHFKKCLDILKSYQEQEAV